MNSNLIMHRILRRSGGLSKLAFTARAGHDYHYAPNEPKPHDYEKPPHEDEIIKIHYLKHYPMYEFKNFSDPEIDSYRYWLRYRFENYGTETSPAETHPWESTPITASLTFLLMPLFVIVFGYTSLKKTNRLKNNKSEIVGIFSQKQI
ncbi:unnamed protein product [Moneuplotes crassus]|uniref:Uncharacterized protein n=1 Tax=Euplotes crassus TaxID=5936 RepID=A0AAD1Y4M5_EUPCR|nr:unnamed protein product [Moneuplotes crassus]